MSLLKRATPGFERRPRICKTIPKAPLEPIRRTLARVGLNDETFRNYVLVNKLPRRRAEENASADLRILVRMAAGDAAALAELYDSTGRAVYTLAVRIVSDPMEAEDVVQEVFAQAWRDAMRYDASRATVIGWLLMITRARGIDRVRARRARPDVVIGTPMPDAPSLAPGQEAILVMQQAATRVRAALHGLGEPLRTPIELAYYEGLSQSAIAERLGQPLGTVKTRMRTALSRLRDVLRAEGS